MSVLRADIQSTWQVSHGRSFNLTTDNKYSVFASDQQETKSRAILTYVVGSARLER